ncbi:MAG: dTDP-4-dehydrorhamnose reductase [Maribacter sp.]
MKTVLVTGANGQLGQCIQKIAPEYYNFDFVFKDSKQLDITDTNIIDSTFSSNHFDFCVNCAAYTNVEQAEKTPEIAFEINAKGVKNMALACKEYKVALIHISSDYVFDGDKIEPYNVEDLPNPINEYGKSKLKGEQFIQNILEEYLIIRTSWLYSEFGNNFYTMVLRKARNGEELHITDQQTGCPTNANNLAKFILKTILKNGMGYGVRHYTDGDAMTWYGFAKKIIEQEGLMVKILPKNYSSRVNRPKYSVLK